MSDQNIEEANTRLQCEIARMHRHADRRKAREDLKRKRNRDNADPDTVPSLEEVAKMESMGFQSFRKSEKSRKMMAKHRANHPPDIVQMPEHDQFANSPMMRLPAELRNRIYEGVLEYDSTSRPAMAPQLLLVCKQIRREAQSILNGNMDNIALIRLSNAERTLISHNLDSPNEVLAVASFDRAFESWTSIIGKRKHALLDVHLVGDGKDTKRPKATYPLISQQRFLLAAALVGSQVQSLNLKLKVSNHWPTGIDYDKCLWPLSSISSHIKVAMRGVPESTQQYLRSPGNRSPDLDCAGSSLWVETFAKMEALISKVERAGIKEGNVRNLLQIHRSRLLTLADRVLVGVVTAAWVGDDIREARDTLHSPMWTSVREQAERVLREMGGAA